MRLDLLIDQGRRYFTRFNLPKAQVLKTGLAVALALIIFIQLFSASSSNAAPSAKKIAVVKPDQHSNENYNSLQGGQFDNTPLSVRCSKFFESIRTKERDSELATQEFSYYSSSSRSFFLLPERDEFLEAGKKQSGGDEKSNDKDYIEHATTDNSRAQRFLTFFSNARIYGTCYIESNIFEELAEKSGSFNVFWDEEAGNGVDDTNLFHLANDFGIKYFSWLTQIKPVYKKMGASTFDSGVPSIDPEYESETIGKASFLYNFRQSLNGKGIVIPVKDANDFDALKRLAKLLRFTGCNLPIQIVHDGFLDADKESAIKDAFTKTITPTDFITLETSEMLPAGFDVNFSPIENVWFVNIAISLDNKYTRTVARDSTFKTLALLFSSFEDALLMDPTVLPFNRLFTLFDTEHYETTGSYYFPSYQINEDISSSELAFIKKLFPTQVDETVFGITEVNEEILSNTRMFKQKKTHSIDNSVVLMNKKDHFLGLLLTAEVQLMPINFDHDSLKKDLLWIVPLAAGASQLSMHQVPAAVVGEFTPEKNRKIQPSVAREMCSQHRAFLDSSIAAEASIYFITDGFRNCDVEIDVEKEKDYPLFSELAKDPKKLKEWSGEATKFQGAIIPLAQEIEAKNNFDEVAIGLQNHGYCGDNIWCAYDVLGAKDDPEFHAVVIDFDVPQQKTLEVMSQVWQKF